jgi:galactokinase
MEANVSVSGRVCLLGDKNDLLNGPVIAAAVSKFLHFKLRKQENNKISFTYDNKTFSRDFDKFETNEFFKFFSQIAWRLKDKIGPFDCVVTGDLPVGCGLSSSSACSIGLIRGLSKLFDFEMSKDEIAELSYQVEHNDLGIMCGRMDQYSIAYGGVTYIETGDETKVTPLKIETIPIVIGNSCEPRQAKTVLNRTMDRLKANDKTYIDAFDRINSNVEKGIAAIKENDMKLLGQLMLSHQEAERAMDATTPRLEAMIKAALDAGALGAKQIGAGGGGCMIALCPNNTENVLKAVQNAGGEAWIADIYNID